MHNETKLFSLAGGRLAGHVDVDEPCVIQAFQISDELPADGHRIRHLGIGVGYEDLQGILVELNEDGKRLGSLPLLRVAAVAGEYGEMQVLLRLCQLVLQTKVLVGCSGQLLDFLLQGQNTLISVVASSIC